MAERKQLSSRDAHIRAMRGSVKSIAERKRQAASVPAPKPAPQSRPAPAPKPAPQSKRKQSKLLYAVFCLTAVTAVCTAVLAGLVITNWRTLSSSRREYADLKDSSSPDEAVEVPVPQTRKVSAFDQSMRRINPEYVCWLNIKGTVIDYPVARAGDNEKYLNVSFSGEENKLGALFMDYRCVGETVPNIIIYGHNTTDGDMFGGLRHFLDERYMTENPTVTLRINDRAVEYEIFTARKTNVNDPAYYLDFDQPGSFASFAERCGAPVGASQIVTLSTCVSGLDKDERVIVQGALIE